MASMKKSISLQQRQYLSNFLHNLETQGEIFHVINILWFSMKLYHRFVASTFALYFLHDVFMKAPNVLFSRCHIKISDYPSHSSLPMYDIFNGENSKLTTLTIFMLAQAGFFMIYWGFYSKKIVTLILKTFIWDYSWGKVKL